MTPPRRRRAVIATTVLATLVVTSPAGAGTRDPGLPNPVLTPGATNPAVTQGNIHRTICVPGYAASVRPPESYTERLKYAALDSGYNYRGDTHASDYEEDHLIPLEVGGNPTSPKNLWPEPWLVTWNAGKKDQLENRLHQLVCDGTVSLAEAQHVFATNWIAGYRRFLSGG